MSTASHADGGAVPKSFVDEHEARVAVQALIQTFPTDTAQIVVELSSYTNEQARIIRALVAVAASLQRRINTALAFREELEEAFDVVCAEVKSARETAADLFGALGEDA